MDASVTESLLQNTKKMDKGNHSEGDPQKAKASSEEDDHRYIKRNDSDVKPGTSQAQCGPEILLNALQTLQDKEPLDSNSLYLLLW